MKVLEGLVRRVKILGARCQSAMAPKTVDHEVRPPLTWANFGDGTLGYKCETDSEIMINVGTVHMARLNEVVRTNTEKAWLVAIPLVIATCWAGYAGFNASRHPTGAVDFQPGALFGARGVSSEEIVALQSSIKSAMTARIAGNYSGAVRAGLTTRYPNWFWAKGITESDVKAAMATEQSQQVIEAKTCRDQIAKGVQCSPVGAIWYRAAVFNDGTNSNDDVFKIFTTPGSELQSTYLKDKKFDDICASNHSEKFYFGAPGEAKAQEAIKALSTSWNSEGKFDKPAGFVKASSKSDLMKASTIKGCDFQPTMFLDADTGPFKHLVQIYYTADSMQVQGIWIGLAEDGGKRAVRIMGCSESSCSNKFGLDEMNYSRSGKTIDFVKSITEVK